MFLDDPKTCASTKPWMDEPPRMVRAQCGGCPTKTSKWYMELSDVIQNPQSLYSLIWDFFGILRQLQI